MTIDAAGALLSAALGVALATLLWRRAGREAARDRVQRALRSESVDDASRLTTMLQRADVEQPAAAVVRTWLLVGVAAGVFGLAMSPALGILAGALTLAAGPVLLVFARHRAERRAGASLPAMLRLIASELRVGGTVFSALDTVATSPHPLARDMARVRKRVELGVAFNDALGTWVEERPVAGVRAAAGALTLARNVGGPAADAVDGLAASVADRIAAVAETRAQSAQARASALVMVLAPVGYLLFASTIDQRSLDVLLGTAFGRTCFAAGLGLDLIAVLWIRFLVRPEAEL